jgi:thioredoxin reductase/NAD-dependent dihydropyrimidine dehydrogenase PreA subunit
MESTSLQTWEDSVTSGLTQPPSLHPVIDPARCIGCESCVHACPEFPAHQVLGIIQQKARLVSPTDCIGHGACQRVCPTGAIRLVFGTSERGIDIPEVNPDFSTNVPGIYIAGELGGMGLIRNAINQGRQAMNSIAKVLSNLSPVENDAVDVFIVGAGPAGIAATLGAMESSLSHVTIEQNALGGTVANFPRGKIVMTAPVELPKVGKVQFTETNKEELIEFWRKVQKKTRMQIQYGERLRKLEQSGPGVFTVSTSRKTYRARTLLLAIGRRGTPRKLEVAGEELAKVIYTLTEPAEHRGKKVLVVGGGDSAIEAACCLADEPGTTVTLSYRSGSFSRAKQKNRDKLNALSDEGRVQILLESNVLAIRQNEVELQQNDELIQLANDLVLICAGGILPDGMLRDMGIEVETKYGTA